MLIRAVLKRKARVQAFATAVPVIPTKTKSIFATMGTKELGNLGEDLACGYLVKNGYKILGRNCVLGIGEIDIIAVEKPARLNKIFQILNSAQKQNLFNRVKGLFIKDYKVIHFVEVKALEGLTFQCFYPEEHVNYKKQNKYKRLVEIWLEKNKFPQNYPCQVDIVAVSIDNGKKEIKHFENI